MVLGGLEAGVTPLGWTYAYSTLANDGDRVSGTLAPRPGDSPVAYTQVTDQDGHTIKGGDNDSTHKQVIPEGVAEEAKSILETVVSSGTGTQRQHRRLGPVGQDRHDREQRRRLVLRRDRRSHRLRLGRLRRHDDADDDPLQRRPGDGRHLPGADLGQRDLGLGRDQGRTRRGSQGREGSSKASDSGSSSSAPDLHGARIVRRNGSRSGARRKRTGEPAPEEAPEAAEPAEPAEPAPSEPAAPSSGGGVTAG